MSGKSLFKLSVEDRELLGARAKARRAQLGLSMHELATALGVPAATINKLERCLPKAPAPCETAWEDALGVVHGWLRNTRLPATLAPHLVTPPSASRRVVATAPQPALDEQLEFLGWRARLRREMLGIPLQELARQAGISSGLLAELERCLGPMAQVREEAWERALQVPPGWLRDTGIDAPAPENAASTVPAELLAALGMHTQSRDSDP